MASYGKKSGGLTGNLAKLGGSSRKLSVKSDMKSDSMPFASKHKGAKQAHKRA